MGKLNTATEIAKKAAQKILFEVILQRAISKAISLVPLLGFPIINPIFVWAFTKGAELLYTELELGADLLLIDARVEGNRHAYDEAVKTFSAAIKQGDQDAVQQAKDEFKARLGSLIRFPRAT